MKNADLKPLEPYKSARTKWKCECLVCGLVGFPMLGNIIVGQGGCTNCQNSFNYHEPSFFYVISNSKLNALKIGIGNSTITKNNRLKKHEKYKWKAEYVFDFENGFLAYEFEQTLLKYLRNKLRLLPHLTRVDMPQGGHSETMDVKKIPLVKLLDLVRKNHLGQL